ncbi:MAG: SCP2 sterol-binding domain-containing protein [Lachnospiraceae bacterium]|nr:SCP2 sterol-binding domain-containing protein [Lachnospiraceae bacterium]
MKINIYYGGRGLIEDPTLYVLNKITEVLNELRVEVNRFNLYEQKGGIAMLPNTMKDADAAVLAVSVEWYGIGGLMQQFLDACWLYADKNKLKKLYMFPVVISTSLGEREAEYHLIRSWELLGGVSFPGICAYAEDHVDFETNSAYGKMIEQAAENMYRTVNHKVVSYPSSTAAGGTVAVSGSPIDLTPQESEQLSIYVSDETFVKKQKEDVAKLTKLYLDKLDQTGDEDKQEFIAEFKKAFVSPEPDFSAVYQIMMTDTERDLVLEVENGKLKVYYGTVQSPNVLAKTTREIVNKLVNGRVTFQGAFMSSQLTCKGDFKLLRSFDQFFRFE